MWRDGWEKGETHRLTPYYFSLPLLLQVYVSPMSVYQRMQDTSSVGVARGVGGAIQWVWVEPGAEQAFDFSAHSKRRHQETRSLIVHQLLVRVAGWGQIDIPVSVDKIGVFFREVCVCVCVCVWGGCGCVWVCVCVCVCVRGLVSNREREEGDEV